ncbi:hypothetical protein PPACK8108_LOCUS15137 [Phakopsora pachyrhizi]|uniref:Uncharacterized protein n=1 Tax=Phakopsora pachyrhizi TaxID=170000 RepID=A0AAV0B830_PHAPC|nr:hypothetical protein PPACK8108_LOCUS15137 [Phakopsora pachyrhizi]
MIADDKFYLREEAQAQKVEVACDFDQFSAIQNSIQAPELSRWRSSLEESAQTKGRLPKVTIGQGLKVTDSNQNSSGGFLLPSYRKGPKVGRADQHCNWAVFNAYDNPPFTC